MKKLLATALAAMMAVTALAGCSNNGDSGNTANTWDKIKEKGELVMGMDDAFPPMGYKDPDTGDLIGFDIDVATAVCEELGIALKTQPIDWNTKEMELDAGNVDCLWNGYSWTEDRDEKVDLSIPYMKNNQIILVKTDSPYQSLDDLAGKILGVQADSSAATALDKAADFKASLGDVVEISDYSKAVLEIQNGTIDAIGIDEVVARYYISHDPQGYRILENDDGSVVSLAVEDYVIGFRKADDGTLKAKVEETLKKLSENGKLAEISEKWFGENVTTVE